MSMQRIVALVGRPNVGKSAMFNRLLRRRLAIVHEQWGVTRDRLAGEAEWDGQRFGLIDTGGIGLMDRALPGDRIVEGTRQQVDAALEDAAVIIMVADAQGGLCPLDEEVARLLHRHGRPVVLAANKSDNASIEAQAVEFSGLGFPVYPVSALHDRGFGELMAAVLAKLPEGVNETIETPLRVAVVGKPNAGKSSYINCLLQSDRVIVSEVPGTTRDSVHVPFTVGEGPQARHYVLTDTAGMRPHGRIHEAVEHYSLLRGKEAIKDSDLAVLVIDATQGPTMQDKKIGALIAEELKGCMVLVNKWDLAEGIRPKDYEKSLREAMPFLAYAPVVFASSATGWQVRQSIETIDLIAEKISQVLTTGVLNRVLRNALEAQSPPAVKGRRLKFFYAAQVGHAPIRLRLFVNDPARVVPTYESYLMNRLRAFFGLEGAPISLQFRSRGGPLEAKPRGIRPPRTPRVVLTAREKKPSPRPDGKPSPKSARAPAGRSASGRSAPGRSAPGKAAPKKPLAKKPRSTRVSSRRGKRA